MSRFEDNRDMEQKQQGQKGERPACQYGAKVRRTKSGLGTNA